MQAAEELGLPAPTPSENAVEHVQGKGPLAGAAAAARGPELIGRLLKGRLETLEGHACRRGEATG